MFLSLLRSPITLARAGTFVGLLSLVVGLGSSVALAQTAPRDTVRQSDTVESSTAKAEQRLLPPTYGINGLLVDETLTITGRDFYALFFDQWEAPPGSVNYTITIGEQPVPGLGTRIVVTVNDRVAFSTRLQPRYEHAEAAALAAIAYTHQALATAAPLSRGL